MCGQKERTYGRRPDLDPVQYLDFSVFLSQKVFTILNF